MRRSFQRFFRPISELGIHHVSSCNYLPLGPGQALSARGSIASRKKGRVLFFVRFVSPLLSSTKPIPFCRSGMGLHNMWKWLMSPLQ